MMFLIVDYFFEFMLVNCDIVLVEIKVKCNISKVYYDKIVGLKQNSINIGEYVYV